MDMTKSNALRRILVPLDGSKFAEQALAYALAVAAPETELVLMEVVPHAEPVRGLLGNVLISAEEMGNVYEKGVETSLQNARMTWLGDRDHVRLESGIGDPAAEILRIAEHEQVDLIVMASHGRGAINRWVIGSVADRVARNALTPAMVIRSREETPTVGIAPPIKRLIVPLDGSDLALQALPFAEVLATSLRVPVTLVHVIDIAHQLSSVFAYALPFRQEVYDEILASEQTKASEYLTSAAARLRDAGLEVSEQLLDGIAPEAISSFAESTDVIVMTSHGRSGVRRWLIGSVAEKLVREGPGPVVIVPSVARSKVDTPQVHTAAAVVEGARA